MCYSRAFITPQSKSVDDDLQVKFQRECTNFWCLIIFLLFWIYYIIILSYGIARGRKYLDVYILIHLFYSLFYGVDYNGDICSKNGKGRYLYFPRMSLDTSTDRDLFGICISSCPKQDSVVCTYEYTTANIQLPAASELVGCTSNSRDPKCHQCWIVPINTENIFGRCLFKTNEEKQDSTVCDYPRNIPASSNNCIRTNRTIITIQQNVNKNNDNYMFRKIRQFSTMIGGVLSDLVNCKWVLLCVTCLFTMVFGFLLIVLTRYFVKCMIYFVQYGLLSMLIIGMFFCFYRGDVFGNAPLDYINREYSNSTSENTQHFVTWLNDVFAPKETTQKAFEVTGWVLLVIILLLILIYIATYKSLNTSIHVLEESSAIYSRLPTLSIIPIMSTICLALLTLFFVYSIALIYTADAEKVSYGVKNTADSYREANVTAKIKISNKNYHLSYLELFGWYWSFQYVNAVVICTIGCAVGIYYFTPLIKGNRNIQVDTPVWKSFLTAVYFHSGSLAFGAVFITIYQLLRYFLVYISKTIEKYEGDSNCCLSMFSNCLRLCVCCCGEILKYVTTSAYIIVGIEGRGLLDSISMTQTLLMKNILTIGTLNGVSVALTIIQKLLIASLSTFFAYFWLSYDERYQAGGKWELYNVYILLVIMMILSYIVAAAFVNIYNIIINSLILCYCKDLTHFAGRYSPYMIPSLQEAVGTDKNIPPIQSQPPPGYDGTKLQKLNANQLPPIRQPPHLQQPQQSSNRPQPLANQNLNNPPPAATAATEEKKNDNPEDARKTPPPLNISEEKKE